MSIQIPDLFTAYNSAKTYGSNRRYDTYYKNHTQGEHGAASACVGCGKCSEICPQGIDVPKEMEQFSEALKKIPSWAEICRQRDAAQARR